MSAGNIDISPYWNTNTTLEERLKPHIFIQNDINPIIPFRLNETYERIFTELAYLQVFAVATIGIIGILPQDISKWEDD